MSVVVVRRRVFLGVFVGILLASCPCVLAETDAELIARANHLIADKQYADAIAILVPLISSTEPTALEAKKALEGCYRATEEPAKRIPLLESILRDYTPNDPGLWQRRLGRCYRETGECDKAAAALTEGVDSGPLPAATTRRLADRLWCCFVSRDEWGEAVDFYKSLLAKWPQREAE